MKEILRIIQDKIRDNSLKKGYPHTQVYTFSPWLIFFLGFTYIGVISFLFKEESSRIRDIFIYVYMGSLLVTGCFNLVVMRFLCSKLADFKRHSLSGALILIIITLFFLALITALLFILPAQESLANKIFTVILFSFICCNWQFYIMMSSSKHFPIITLCFFICSFLSLFLAFMGNILGGASISLNALTLGNALIFFIFYFLAAEELKIKYNFNPDFFLFVRKKPVYLVLGIIITLGILADKFVFWISAAGKGGGHIFSLNYIYDSAMSLAFMCALPAVSFFFIAVEKKIYSKYRELYKSIIQGKCLAVVESYKKNFTDHILASFYDILKIQMAVVFSVNYLATHIFTLLKLPLETVSLFRIAVWGVSIYMVIAFIVTLLLYLNLWKHALCISLVFLICNTGFSFITISPLFPCYGYGFSLSSIITLILSLFIIFNILKRLIYIMLCNPPFALRYKKIGQSQIGNYLVRNGKRV